MIKKGTDVLEIEIVDGGERVLIKTKSKLGLRLISALESVVGSPALDEYTPPVTESGENTIKISRYQLSEDTKLSND